MTSAPIVRVVDVAYPIFAAPDLDLMQQFLEDFGMAPAGHRDGALYMRGAGPDAVVHKTILGDPAFVGLAFRAASQDDLFRLAGHFGVEVKRDAGPAGAWSVAFSDPDGRIIEVQHGGQPAPPAQLALRAPDNLARNRGRLGQVKRVSGGPAQVVRFGHAAMKSADMETTVAWYQEVFGLLESDRFYVGEATNVAGIFMRCDRGAQHTDHHTILIQASQAAGLGHCGWEVADVDDVMVGHDHMLRRGHAGYWGVGRHVLGSQVFDYWRDPWGHVVEHWTDGDVLDASAPPGAHAIETVLGQWGPMPPADF